MLDLFLTVLNITELGLSLTVLDLVSLCARLISYCAALISRSAGSHLPALLDLVLFLCHLSLWITSCLTVLDVVSHCAGSHLSLS